jgi:hypothetical protein
MSELCQSYVTFSSVMSELCQSYVRVMSVMSERLKPHPAGKIIIMYTYRLKHVRTYLIVSCECLKELKPILSSEFAQLQQP